MQILEVELSNYRNVDSLKIDLRPGITGLWGHNGSGKSSLLSAICFGTTGLVLGDDTKGELLQWGQSKGYVKIKFRAHDKVYVIKRNIQGSVVDLREEGAPKASFSSRESIDEFMLSLIGLHPRLYDKVLFIEQEGLDSLLKATHSKRSDFFNDLFDATITEKLRGLLQTYIQKIPALPDYEPEKEALYAVIATERAEHTKQTTELKGLDNTLTALPDVQVIMTASARLSKADVDAEIASRESRIAQFRITADCLHNMSIPIFISAEREGHYQQFKVMKAKEQALKDAKAAFASMEKPKKDKFIGVNPEQTWASLLSDNKMLTEKLRLCELGKCPECGSTYKGANREKLIEKQRKTEDKVQIVLKYINDTKAIDAAQANLTFLETDTKNHLLTAQNEVIVFDEEEYLKDQETIRTQAMQIQEYRDKQALSVAAESSIITLNNEISDLNKKETITDEEKAQYAQVLETYKKIQDKQRILQGTVQGLATALTMRESRIQDILIQEKKAERARSFVALLTRVRNVLHRDCLPQVRVAAGLTYINVKLAEWLDHFNVPFTMKVNRSCDFIVSFKGEEKPFKVLSGGQRKVAAIAFRMAVAEIFGGDMGILSLDEPAAYMDFDAKTNLVDILTKAASRAVAINMHVFIATHEVMLVNAFTSTFNMEEGQYDNAI